jgi:Flp pilus assembly protein TadB
MADDEESPRQRRNRELGELMQELRVALPGVQVLFGFLLTVPFTDAFKRLSLGEKRVYIAAVLATAVSSLLLIAPAANHRLLFRTQARERLLRAANRVAVVGFVTLALGIGLSLYLVSTVVYGGVFAGVASGLVAATTVFFWFVFPGVLREEEEDHPVQND